MEFRMCIRASTSFALLWCVICFHSIGCFALKSLMIVCIYWAFCSAILPREPMPSNITIRLPTSQELETYALQQWEVNVVPLFLHFSLSFLFLFPKNSSALSQRIPQNCNYSWFLQLLNFSLSFHNFLIVIKQCFLLQLINSAQAERMTNISPSMMRIFQRGLLTQRHGFHFILLLQRVTCKG